MFDIKGHKIEICGVHDRTPPEVKTLEEDEIDISDIGQINECLAEPGGGGFIPPERFSMIVWGEDLARIPLIIYSDEGDVMYRCEMLTDDHFKALDEAARLVNRVLEEEQASAVVDAAEGEGRQ